MTTTSPPGRRDREWWTLLAVWITLLLGAGGSIAAGLVEEPADAAPVALPAYAYEPDASSPPAAIPGPRRPGSWTARPATAPRATVGRDQTPQRLEVPRLDLALPVVRTGVDQDGQMALPKRPTEIGWYAYGPRPGDRRGSAVLGGHRDSRRFGTGPLAALESLRPGDEIVVVHASGRARFSVQSVKTIGKPALPDQEIFNRDGRPTLRIITCGGSYLRGRGYTDNVVVTARLR